METSRNLFTEHEWDDLEYMKWELSLVIRAGEIQQQVLSTTHMQRPAHTHTHTRPHLRLTDCNIINRSVGSTESKCTSADFEAPVAQPDGNMPPGQWSLPASCVLGFQSCNMACLTLHRGFLAINCTAAMLGDPSSSSLAVSHIT